MTIEDETGDMQFIRRELGSQVLVAPAGGAGRLLARCHGEWYRESSHCKLPRPHRITRSENMNT